MNSPIIPTVTLTEAELEAVLQRAATHGAKKALADIGLHDKEAAGDVKELRGLLDSWRSAKSTAWKTFVSWSVKGLLLLIVAGLYFKTGNVMGDKH